MAVEDGYNVERSILGQNDANNEQDTSLVAPNADGSAVERLEYIQTLLASLDTASLQTLIEAIQGTGFSDVTDSLKVLSDVIDTITGVGFATETDSLKILSDNINSIKTLLNDANLVAGNIKVGVTIAGITGTYTADADAVEGDIVAGKTAYVNGVKLTGTHV